jgi:UPF0271 protein
MPRIDLNCDLGEGAGHDVELMPLITSANIACGAHAGDEATMRATVQLAMRHGVAIGAHPGFADRENFGRRELALSLEEIHVLVLHQVRALQAITLPLGGHLVHVKPHGALYNLAARDAVTARAIAAAVRDADPRLRLVGLAGSRLLEAGSAAGLVTISEVFADRTYQPDGSLTPRDRPEALIEKADLAVTQVLRLACEGRVQAIDGRDLKLQAGTVCLHGDGRDAVAFARQVSAALRAAGVELSSVAK